MKGVIFTEFLEFAEEQFGAEDLSRSIAAAALPSGGHYSAVGHYDHHELIRLVQAASASHDLPEAALLRRFGCYLFERFASLYPAFVIDADSAMSFLASIDTYIHGELQKLYPDSEFPRFECRMVEPDRLEMVYSSRRRLADFAEGLIDGCVAHFGDPVEVRRDDLPNGDEQRVRFSLVGRAPNR